MGCSWVIVRVQICRMGRNLIIMPAIDSLSVIVAESLRC
jgi:virulence-associated protein VagC